MIKRLSHATFYCHDQESALDFYTNKLGFEVRTDKTLHGFRWLTVGPKPQPDFEIVLVPVKPGPMMDEETCKLVRQMLEKGVMGGGVFNTDDCQKTYEELRAKGVEFLSPPVERPYGIEAVLKDNSGNWFSVTQRP